jgi:ATP-dependent Clp protease ATP-binding subunit ClpX
MAKSDQLDLALPVDFLRLGEVLSSAGPLRRPIARDEAGRPASAEQVEAMADALLEKACKSTAARRTLGLRQRTAKEAARVRLKAAAVLGWQHLRASSSHVAIGDLAAACASQRLPPAEGHLRARHEIGLMVAEDALIGTADDSGAFVRVRLPSPGLEFLAGGKASLGALTTGRLAGILLPKGIDEYERPPADAPIPTAGELRARITGKVIGLDRQVAALSSLLVMHLARARLIRAGNDGGANCAILLVAPSGAGKTWMLETAGAVTQCPFASVSATAMTSEAFQGGKVDDLFKALVLKANGDVQAARFGLAFTDEWDSKAMRHSTGGSREVTTLCVQQEYLVPMQGAEFLISGKRSMERPIMFDSRGTFFAFAGAFAGLDEVIRKRNGRGCIGFAAPSGARTRRQQYLLDAVAEYGYLRTWTNRLSSVLFLPAPSAESLGRAGAHGILDGTNAILGELGVVLFPQPNGTVERIVEYALETRTFYRGVRSVWWAVAEAAVSADAKGTVVVTPGDVDAAIRRLATGSAGPAEAGGSVSRGPDGEMDGGGADGGHGWASADG